MTIVSVLVLHISACHVFHTAFGFLWSDKELFSYKWYFSS